MARIVISYRRDDASAHAGRIYDRLRTEYGPDQVFMDIDAIEPGVDFVEAIEEAIGSADVLIAVIGRRWTTVAAQAGTPRIMDPRDFVRLELAVALERNIRVIPVLVDGATMPTVDELPEDLSGLVRRNAIDISHARFHADAQRLAHSVRKILDEPEASDEIVAAPKPRAPRIADDPGETAPPERPKRKSWRYAFFGGAALLAIAVIAAAYLAVDYLTLPPEPSSLAGSLAWSADGQRIAFSGRTVTGDINLYSAAVDGSGWLELQNDADAPVTWSPDGRWITFERALHYHLMGAYGSDSRELPGDAILGGSLAWSPDGTKVAYWSGELGGGRIELRVVNVADNDARTALATRALGSGREHGIAWSPDSDRIAAVVSRDDQDELVVISASGEVSGVFRSSQIEYPGWGADGEWLVFSAGSSTVGSSEQAIFRIRPDGTELTRLTDEGVIASGSRVSPDGRVVAAMVGPPFGSRQYYLVDIDGSRQWPVTSDTLGGYAETLAWSPDGDRLAFVAMVNTGRLFGSYRTTVIVTDREGRARSVLPQ